MTKGSAVVGMVALGRATFSSSTAKDLRRMVSAPDSKLVHDVQEFARTSLEPYLFNHVRRSWLFAMALAKTAEVRPDPDLLSAAVLLHDLGLTEQFSSDTERFEVDGANAAREFLKAYKLAPSDLQLVWDAIALHSTRSIALHKGPVVALCHQGVQVDISGLQLDRIQPTLKHQLLLEYPRLSLKTRLTDCLCAIVRRKPTTYDNFMRDFGERFVSRLSRAVISGPARGGTL